MKLRMNDRSVRLRLLRSEVERFHATGAVESAIQFPNGRALRYRLNMGEVAEPVVTFTGDMLDIAVPRAEGESWSGGTAVGMYGKSASLDILVEKDFRRTSAPSPDDDDRYPNPRAAQAGARRN